MIRLIKNELFKVFHKKATFVLLIIMVVFAILTNVIYKNINFSYTSLNYSYEDIDYAKEYLANNEKSTMNVDDYAYYNTIIKVNGLLDKYNEEWQKEALTSDVYQAYLSYYYSEYNDDKENMNKLQDMIDKLMEAIDSNNWQVFVNSKIESIGYDIDNLESQLKTTTRKSEEVSIKATIDTNKKEIELLEYRLKENLPIGGHTYLDDAINGLNALSYLVYENKYNDVDRYKIAGELREFKVNEYILEHKEDVNNIKSSRGIIVDFYSEYYFLILVFAIMIAGSIVSDEFNKGTIKSLLILPYSRTKIIISKFITTIIMILFGILAMFAIQFVVGGLFFGFSSLSIPFVTYNVASESLVTMNVFAYFGLITITMLPKLLLLSTLAFALSTILTNTAAAIAITFCGYIGEAIVNALARTYDIKFLDYFVTTCWDFNNFLFGGKSAFNLSLTHSIIVCVAYFAFMIIVAFIFFKKKDIKNI